MLQIFLKKSRILNNSLYLQQKFYSTKIKDHFSSFPNVYEQKNVEKLWSSVWLDCGLFRQTKNVENDPNAFRLLLPPPNITGNLHLGHSLTVAIQDAICRYQRMNGKPVIWYGGTDHAGIATQMLVEKMIFSKYGKSRHDLTKEEFDKFFQEWKNDKTTNIHNQLRALGASLDFEKSYFTLSPELQDFVQDSFIELFNRGHIYRASYMVNWSYYLQSTLSDIEIEHKYISKSTMMNVPGCDEKFEVGVLHHFRYPVMNSTSDGDFSISKAKEYLTVATTRIESVVGDVALAVNPNDERYSRLIGSFAYNPFTKQPMPIIPEPEVKIDFGTGVLKLTPAHCLEDSELAKKHNLPLDLLIFDEKGFMKCSYEKFNGIHRLAAKKVIVNELASMDLYEGVKDHGHWLPLCSRCGDIIEQKQVPQWFLNADNARFATEFVVNRDNLSDISMKRWKDVTLNERNISLIPSGYRNTWRDWFSRYKDWCISRQITWGHQIPAYEIIDSSGEALGWVASKSEDHAKELAKTKFPILNNSDRNFTLRKDKDVLDTWFSSALLPIAISKDYPLSLMETGHDILFFWVARMVLMSILLKNRLPFDRVLLHGMVCDQKGKKMSKSKGNVIDPLHVINGAKTDVLISDLKKQFESGAINEKVLDDKIVEYVKTIPRGIDICGADILRLSLLQSDFKEAKVKFNLQKTLRKRSFVNKMHHTVRFLILKLEENEQIDLNLPQIDALNSMDKWIYHRLSELIQETKQCFESYDLHEASIKIEKFWYDDLCNVYLEYFKQNTQNLSILIDIIVKTLQIFHPFMPFVTEHLYQYIQYKIDQDKYEYKSILTIPYPTIESNPILKTLNPKLDGDFDDLFDIIRKIRWFKANFTIQSMPIISKICILSNNSRIEEYFSIIQSSIKLDDCQLEYRSLHDIYSLDDNNDWYCFLIENESSSNKADSNEDNNNNNNHEKESYQSSSLKSNEIYIAFQIDRNNLIENFQNSRSINKEKIDKLLEELDNFHFRYFTKNYKKLTKINV